MSSRNRETSNAVAFMTLWKSLGIGFLGAIIAVAITIPLSITFHISIPEITTTTVLTTTTTTTTTTMAIITSTTATASASTTRTTTTATTSTTSTTTTKSTTVTTTTTTTTTINNVTSCTFPCLCAGVAPYTSWQPYPTIGIYMTINTSNCNFNRTPMYFTSMSGILSHSVLSGYGAIYGPTSTSFTIYSMSVSFLNTSTLMSLATSDIWNVYWFGLYY